MPLPKRWFWLFLALAAWYAVGRPFMDVDGLNHLAILRSFLADRDFCLDNQRMFPHFGLNPYFSPYFLKPTGYLTPDQPLGMSVVSLPWGLLALGWTAIQGVCENGESWPFVALYSLGGFLAVLAGLRVLFFLFGKTKRAGWTVAGLFLCTPLLFYALIFPTYSHGWNFVSGTIFLWAWWRWRFQEGIGQHWERLSLDKTFLLGTSLGLMQLLRYEGILIGATLLAVDFAWDLLSLKKRQGNIAPVLKRVPLVFLGWFLTMSPQLFLWKFIYGGWTGPLAERAGHGAIPFNGEFLAKMFFNPQIGIFTQHLWVAILFAGLLMGLRREPRLFLPLFAGVVVQCWFYSGVQWVGISFGYRYLCLLLPFLAFGGLEVFQCTRPWVSRGAKGLTVVFAVQNMEEVLMAPYVGWLVEGKRIPWMAALGKLPAALEDAWKQGWFYRNALEAPWTWLGSALGLAAPLLAVGMVLLIMVWGQRISGRFDGSKIRAVGALGLLVAFLGMDGWLIQATQKDRLWREFDFACWRPTNFSKTNVLRDTAPAYPRRLPEGKMFVGRYEGGTLYGSRTYSVDLGGAPVLSVIQGAGALFGHFDPGETAAIVRLYSDHEVLTAEWPLIAGEDLGSVREGPEALTGKTLVRQWLLGEYSRPPGAYDPDPLWLRSFGWKRELPKPAMCKRLEVEVTGTLARRVYWFGMAGLPAMDFLPLQKRRLGLPNPLSHVRVEHGKNSRNLH